MSTLEYRIVVSEHKKTPMVPEALSNRDWTNHFPNSRGNDIILIPLFGFLTKFADLLKSDKGVGAPFEV
jgi:hypothetical protein